MLVLLSRIQFAFTIMYHFIFVPLTIGLILLVAIFETMHHKKKDDRYRKIADFFGNIFIVNYAIGIVTGIIMSVQFGTNWSEYSVFMGDVFGAPLALEALIAFFLESTFTGIYIFRRKKMSSIFRVVTAWMIFIGTSISALWIITANGFMQHPVGYELSADGSHVLLTSIIELVTNPYAWYMLIHNNASAILLGAFFVLGISSYRLLDKNISEYDREAFTLGVRISSIVALISALITPIIGSKYTAFVAQVNPDKMAAIGGESEIVRIAFLIMVGLGTLFILMSLYVVLFKDRYLESIVLKRLFVYSFILPYIAILSGWVVAEVGRQPWVVYGLLKTSEAVSDVPVAQVVFSLLTTMILYIFIFVVVIKFMISQVNNPLDYVKYDLAFELPSDDENEQTGGNNE